MSKRKQNKQADLEKEQILNPEKLEEKKKKRRKKYIFIAACSIVLCIGLLIGGFQIVRAMGKNRLQAKTDSMHTQLAKAMTTQVLTKEEEDIWQEGWVKYKDTIYKYNEDILTFLIMGIDKNSDAVEVAEGTNGGQADALFLVVMDQKDKSLKVIGINRNTMASVDVYNEEGAYVTTIRTQIAVQHGFGNGVEESCEYQQNAVEQLFYGLPIHGYAAINMSAIATINDSVGGVDVTVLEDLTKRDPALVKDAKVHLMGETAFWYVKYRDIDVFASANMRLERQKQYLKSFIGAAKQAAKNDITIALDLYQAIMPQMITDISIDEVAYLAPIIVNYSFDDDSFYMMEGSTVKGDSYEEFYPDEEALKELVIEVFYEEVK